MWIHTDHLVYIPDFTRPEEKMRPDPSKKFIRDPDNTTWYLKVSEEEEVMVYTERNEDTLTEVEPRQINAARKITTRETTQVDVTNISPNRAASVLWDILSEEKAKAE